MRKSFLISTTCFLVCAATSLFNFSPSLAQNQAEGSKLQRRPTVTSFECRGFSPTIFKIALKKNKTYTIQSRSVNIKPPNTAKTLIGGKYVSFRNQGKRILNGLWARNSGQTVAPILFK